MKLFMMPHTVPNRPTNGAVAPMVARMPVPRIICRPAAASRRSSREAMRSFTPAGECASADSRNSASAARTSAATPLSRRLDARRWLRSRSAPESSASIAARSRRRAAISSMALANQIVQVSTEAKARPTITAFTTMSAAMNMPQGDRSRGSVALAMVRRDLSSRDEVRQAPMAPRLRQRTGGAARLRSGCADGAAAGRARRPARRRRELGRRAAR